MKNMDRRIPTVSVILLCQLLALVIVACSGRFIEPVAGYSQVHTYSSVGEYLSSRGCTQAISLVGEHLTRTRTRWDINVSLGSGADFLPTFKLRYGIDYRDRRSPIEVETLVETYEKVRAEIESHPEVLSLPVGYRLSEQDKTDLFYVMGPRGGLAIREILEPLLRGPEPVPPVEPAEPVPGPPEPLPGPVLPPVVLVPPFMPPSPPLPPVCPPVVPCEVCSPTVPTPTPLVLSPESLSTLDSLSKWVIGSGRKSKVNKLVKEIRDKARSTGQVNVVVVP